MDIKILIENQVLMYNSIGHPAIMERFILANGRNFGNILHQFEYERMKIARDEPKMCFMNATHLAFRHDKFQYVEGYAVRESIGLLVHHAWVIDDKDRVIDTTWDEPEECQYYGVPFDLETLKFETFSNDYYGLLSGPCMINVDFLSKIDDNIPKFLEKWKNRHVSG